jgi:WD40 repeat protein
VLPTIPSLLQEYCLVTNSTMCIYEGTGGLVTRVTPDKRALCVLQQADSHVLSGHEDGTLRLWDVRSGQQAASVAAHKVRVRALASLTPGTLRPACHPAARQLCASHELLSF